MRCLAPSFTMQNDDRLGVLEEKHVLKHEVNVRYWQIEIIPVKSFEYTTRKSERFKLPKCVVASVL